MKFSCIILLVLLVVPVRGMAGTEFVARVLTVHEGDHVTIHYQGRNERVALRDVDCPDLKQPYGKQAKHAAAAYLANRDVVVRELMKDQQGRMTADILLQDGRNIAHELVKEGLAWVQPGEVHDPALRDMEELARASKQGLWSEPDPISPWKWKPTKPARHNEK
ncbi:MAG: thermonuclease family protein [Nitrospira sp.]|nr:thermonuclease family protein [Nitrospira sp.]